MSLDRGCHAHGLDWAAVSIRQRCSSGSGVHLVPAHPVLCASYPSPWPCASCPSPSPVPHTHPLPPGPMLHAPPPALCFIPIPCPLALCFMPLPLPCASYPSPGPWPCGACTACEEYCSDSEASSWFSRTSFDISSAHTCHMHLSCHVHTPVMEQVSTLTGVCVSWNRCQR